MPRCLLVFEPPDGGVAAHVATLAQALVEHGWSPVVAGPSEAVVYPQLERAGVPIVRLPIGRALRPLPYARALRDLIRLGHGGRFDLIHAHSSKAGVIARKAAWLTGTPSVYTPHCFGFVGPVSRQRRVAATVVEAALGRVTDAIVCVADEERRVALTHHVAPAARLHVVHNGSPSCDGSAPPLPALADLAAGDGPVAGCVSVLRGQKGIDVFVRAAADVLARVPAASLAVVGDGELRAELEALAERLELGPRLRFVDFAPPSARALRGLDVFVLPSRWEAFPISVLEALACGVPQVATDVGGTSEAVVDGETGLLCPPDDPRALANAIVALLDDPVRRQTMGVASRERHQRRFTVAAMAAATVEVYAAALARHDRTRVIPG
jgi:glycosyltransferase involved in cell wall biosynthesis